MSEQALINRVLGLRRHHLWGEAVHVAATAVALRHHALPVGTLVLDGLGRCNLRPFRRRLVESDDGSEAMRLLRQAAMAVAAGGLAEGRLASESTANTARRLVADSEQLAELLEDLLPDAAELRSVTVEAQDFVGGRLNEIQAVASALLIFGWLPQDDVDSLVAACRPTRS